MSTEIVPVGEGPMEPADSYDIIPADRSIVPYKGEIVPVGGDIIEETRDEVGPRIIDVEWEYADEGAEAPGFYTRVKKNLSSFGQKAREAGRTVKDFASFLVEPAGKPGYPTLEESDLSRGMAVYQDKGDTFDCLYLADLGHSVSDFGKLVSFGKEAAGYGFSSALIGVSDRVYLGAFGTFRTDERQLVDEAVALLDHKAGQYFLLEEQLPQAYAQLCESTV